MILILLRIHHPLPLPHQGKPDPVVLQGIILLTKEELSRLRGLDGQDTRDGRETEIWWPAGAVSLGGGWAVGAGGGDTSHHAPQDPVLSSVGKLALPHFPNIYSEPLLCGRVLMVLGTQ